VGLAYLLVLAVAVSLSAIAIGAILSTALLIGPPAAALRLVKRTGAAMVVATLLGIGATWLGVLLAYDSASWTSSHSGWPVSFFVVAIVFLLYLLAQLVASVRGTRRPAARTPEGA
jgi:zinc/manganese transport system permease protein